MRNSYRALSKWEFDAGIRFSYFDELEKLSFEPRFAIICKIMEDLSANLSYGVHNQFVHRLEKIIIQILARTIGFYLRKEFQSFYLKTFNLDLVGIKKILVVLHHFT